MWSRRWSLILYDRKHSRNCTYTLVCQNFLIILSTSSTSTRSPIPPILSRRISFLFLTNLHMGDGGLSLTLTVQSKHDISDSASLFYSAAHFFLREGSCNTDRRCLHTFYEIIKHGTATFQYLGLPTSRLMCGMVGGSLVRSTVPLYQSMVGWIYQRQTISS